LVGFTMAECQLSTHNRLWQCEQKETTKSKWRTGNAIDEDSGSDHNTPEYWPHTHWLHTGLKGQSKRLLCSQHLIT